jgi:hypothetical protein
VGKTVTAMPCKPCKCPCPGLFDTPAERSHRA